MDDVEAMFVSVIKVEDVEIKEEFVGDYQQWDESAKQESPDDYNAEVGLTHIGSEIKQVIPEDCCENNAEVSEECAMEEETQPSCGQNCAQNKDIEYLEARVGRLECLLELLVSKVNQSSKSKPDTTTSSLSVKKPITWNNGYLLTSSSTSEAKANMVQTYLKQSNTKQPASSSTCEANTNTLQTNQNLSTIHQHVVIVQKYPITKNSEIVRKNQSVLIVDVNKSGSANPKISNFIKCIPEVIATKKSVPATPQCSHAKNLESEFISKGSLPTTLQYLHAKDLESEVITTKSIPTIPQNSDIKKLVPAIAVKSNKVDSKNSNPQTVHIDIAVNSNYVYQKSSDANKPGFVYDESALVDVNLCESSLAYAVQTGELCNVKIALEKQPTLQQVAESLVVASSSKVVRALCDHCPYVVNMVEASRALFLAAEFGRINILKILLEAGTDPNACNRNSLTVLHKAASKGYVNCVRSLLKHGANISATTNWRCTALHMAAMYGAVKCIAVLLESGASVDEPDNMGCTALHYAVRCKSPEAIQLLLKAGANPKFENMQGETPFDFKCSKTVLTDNGAGKQGISRSSDTRKVEKETGRRTYGPHPKSSYLLKNHIEASKLEPEKKMKKILETDRIEVKIK